MAARLYSLFEKIDGKWIRKSNLEYTKQQAIRVFQTALLNGSMSGKIVELRPVKLISDMQAAAAKNNS